MSGSKKKRCVVGSMLSERVYARPYELRVREVLSGIQCAHVVLMYESLKKGLCEVTGKKN